MSSHPYLRLGLTVVVPFGLGYFLSYMFRAVNAVVAPEQVEAMKDAGWEADTTPGRHVLGSNYYWYFRNPSGGNTEYFADMDRMDDDWEPRIWEESPGFAIWTMDDGAMA